MFSPSASPRHLLTMFDLSADEINHILNEALQMKRVHSHSTSLTGRSIVLLLEKTSLRTRVSFESGLPQLGGHSISYPIDSFSTFGKESISDVARTLSCFVSLVVVRFKLRSTVEEFSRFSSVPVINGLDDFAHPCQILADLLTIRENFGENYRSEIRIAFIGQLGSNVAFDWMRAAAALGIKFSAAGPDGKCDKSGETKKGIPIELIKQCESVNKITGGSLELFDSPDLAVSGASVVISDTWRNYEAPALDSATEEKLKKFQVNESLMSRAAPSAIFLHCLPAQREFEVTTGVIDGPQSRVFQEAENRLHVQKAIVLFLLGKIPLHSESESKSAVNSIN